MFEWPKLHAGQRKLSDAAPGHLRLLGGRGRLYLTNHPTIYGQQFSFERSRRRPFAFPFQIQNHQARLLETQRNGRQVRATLRLRGKPTTANAFFFAAFLLTPSLAICLARAAFGEHAFVRRAAQCTLI